MSSNKRSLAWRVSLLISLLAGLGGLAVLLIRNSGASESKPSPAGKARAALHLKRSPEKHTPGHTTLPLHLRVHLFPQVGNDTVPRSESPHWGCPLRSGCLDPALAPVAQAASLRESVSAPSVPSRAGRLSRFRSVSPSRHRLEACATSWGSLRASDHGLAHQGTSPGPSPSSLRVLVR